MSILDDVTKTVKQGFWGSLIRTNTGVSSLNFFLVCTTIAGIALLSIIPFAIIWEVTHNNMVSSDLTGWAAFIGAVSTMFATAGISKSWSNWSENKFNSNTDGASPECQRPGEDEEPSYDYSQMPPHDI